MTVPVTEIAQQNTVRLIPSAQFKPPLLRALVDSDDELRIVAALEGETSRRLTAGTPAVNLDAWGATHIQAAFSYRRKGGNRFNDEQTGAWYAGFRPETALHEVAFHKTRELGFIGHYHDAVAYVALHASFIGRFHDLRALAPTPACLDPDVTVGYALGQALARELAAQGARGLIYPSVRHRGGTCIVACRPNVVQDVVPGARWQLRWEGSPEWQASPL